MTPPRRHWLLRALLPLFAAMSLLAPRGASADGGGEELLGRVIHTPWLALRFEQDGQRPSLVTTETLVTQVELARAPFTIILPVRGEDDTYQLAGWDDASIFALAASDQRAGPERATGTPAYFGDATGMADTGASSGTLMLNLRGHHYLQGLRLGPDRDRHVFHVSEVMGLNRQGIVPIEAVDGPLYLVVWFDENGDDAMSHGEYEFLILNFGGS